MTKRVRFAINGFGRIGRAVVRQWLAGMHPTFELVAINDIAPPQTCAYLLEYDSIYGPLNRSVSVQDGYLHIGQQHVQLTHSHDLSTVDLQGVDIVFDCTGKANTRDFATAGQRAGAKYILISGPSDAADITIVEGANHSNLQGQKVVSNASCTTNALAPLLQEIDSKYGLVSAHMTTIHCYTGSQPTIDAPRNEAPERNRAAALSMVPTTTSAMRMLHHVTPHLADRVSACAVRVPTASVSAIDLTCNLRTPATPDQINTHLTGVNPQIIGATDKPLVSVDLKGRTESFILACPQTSNFEGGLTRIFGWYDNEFGFSARMFDVAARMLGHKK